MNKIFTIEDGKVVVTPDVLNIPWLRVVYDKYELPMAALNYLHYMSDPISSYFNLGEDERSDRLLKEFPGDYKITDIEITEAFNNLIDLRVNYDPIVRMKVANEVMMNKLSIMCEGMILDDSKEGNLDKALKILEKTGKFSDNHVRLSKVVEEKLNKGRGGVQLSYDM